MNHSSLFPEHDHDHDRCAADALHHAEKVCARRGERLTPIRRQVLEALLTSHQPLGAYELIESLGVEGKRPAPITIYRALDFLREQGLVHRIESRNAFIACLSEHAADATIAFFLCEQCGLVGEPALPGVAQSLARAAKSAGFSPKMSVVEMSGLCAHCADKAK